MFIKLTIHVLAFIGSFASMLIGVFAPAGVCALVFGSSILDTALGDPPDRTHPAFYLYLGLMIPGMLVGACGGIFGLVIPLYQRFQIPLGKGNQLLRHWLHHYALRLADYTKPQA